MRKYEFVFDNGRILEIEAEMDTIKEGCVILSRKKEHKGVVARTDVTPQIVRVISLAHLHDYGYTENA